MFDICTVVFQDELPILRSQAQSLDLYAWNLQPRSIWVVVNDQAHVAQMIDPAWWGDLAPRVHVLTRDVFGSRWSETGWVSQQALKLMVPAISNQPWTLCLDAKTLLVHALAATDLVDREGRARVGRCPIYPVFEASREISEQFWHVTLADQLGPGGVPFLFHNPSVRHMIAHVVERTQEHFPHWFQDQGCLTEFMFYSAWIQHQALDLYTGPSVIRPVNLCHSEPQAFDHKAQQWPQATTVSIHRGAWPRLTAQQQETYRTFLAQRGITHWEQP